MATFKAEVYAHQKKQDGTYNIKIRVTHNQKKKYLATSYYVTKEDLTRSMKIKNQYYIDETDKLIKRYRKICDRFGDSLKSMTVDQIVGFITSEKEKDYFDLDIVSYGRSYVKKLESEGRSGSAQSYNSTINNLIKFTGRDQIGIREITVRFLNDWISWLKDMPSTTARKRGSRAQSLYPSNLRSIHNMAKREFNDEDLGIIRIPFSPFDKIKIPKVSTSRKRAIDVEAIRNIAKLEYTINNNLEVNRFNLAKDLFILSFGLIGMNAVDLYNCDSYKDGRITYQRTKTKNRRSDHAEISIKVEPEIAPLVEKYRDPTGERVFKFHQMYSSVNTFTRALNGYDKLDKKGKRHIVSLKKIGEVIGVDDLEFYAARHSWATIAANEAGIDKYTVHSALNHVDDSMRVTDIYIKKSFDPIDKANRKVLDYVKLDIGSVDEPKYEKPSL